MQEGSYRRVLPEFIQLLIDSYIHLSLDDSRIKVFYTSIIRIN
jgi:hypothetical protein